MEDDNRKTSRQYFGEYNDDAEEHGIGIYESHFYFNLKTNLYGPGHTYAGQFNHNKAEGIGVKLYNIFHSENEMYCGEYKNNERNGIGCTKFATGGMFIGEHKNHIIDGFGVFVTWEGLKFIGRCFKNHPTQKGKWYDKNDNEIDITNFGYDKFGCKYIRDTKIWPSGAKYTGKRRNGKPHGLGTKIWEDGCTYTGFWVDGRKEGQGTMTYQYGNTYVGEWKNGEMHGQGVYTSTDGFRLDGRKFTEANPAFRRSVGEMISWSEKTNKK